MDAKRNPITRYGAYGVLWRDNKILLTLKKSGPYKGLWGLPGGAIEFGEAPEETLKRELLEETALEIHQVKLLSILTSFSSYDNNDLHHLGIIYTIESSTLKPNFVPEEESRWFSPHQVKLEELTPFAREIIEPELRLVWRPYSNIRAKVIGLAEWENRLLVCEVQDDHGILKGWCPLGGGVEFGETAEEALKREIFEETGSDIIITGSPRLFENIFEHHGVKGHEIISAFPISFKNPQIYTQERFQIYENRGRVHWVEWVDILRFKTGREKLFPPALAAQILSM